MLTSVGHDSSIYSATPRSHRTEPQQFNVDPIEVRIYRRGHPMFMSTPGQYTKNRIAAAQPMDRIYFGGNDSGGPESLTSESVRLSQVGAEWANLILAGKPGARELAKKALATVAE